MAICYPIGALALTYRKYRVFTITMYMYMYMYM